VLLLLTPHKPFANAVKGRMAEEAYTHLHVRCVHGQVLNDAEKAWVDTYHKEVWEKVSCTTDCCMHQMIQYLCGASPQQCTTPPKKQNTTAIPVQVSPRLSGEPLDWLRAHTQPLTAAEPVTV
jgi:hypothetical protein